MSRYTRKKKKTRARNKPSSIQQIDCLRTLSFSSDVRSTSLSDR